MNINSVSIREYRNISEMDIQLAPLTNIFVGLNGQGKTNFLEAVYFSLRGHSFRTQNNQDLIRRSSPLATDSVTPLTRIAMSIQRDRMVDSLSAVIMDHKKIIKINEKPTSTTKLLSEFPVILFSPDSLSAIKDGPEERRELMNEMLVLGNPQDHRIINDYQKALRNRNRFLKDNQEVDRKIINYELLGALSETLFNLAIDLIEARRSILMHLMPAFYKSAQAILKQPNNSIHLGYLMSDEDVLGFSRSQIENKLHSRRLELYDAELSSGTTLWGPHKHDLLVTYGGNSARYFCSQGQQRALILALKISQIVHHFECYGKYPILLLDDVFSELDKERKAYLLDFLSQLKTQSILTCTDVESVENVKTDVLNARLFEVSSGRGALVRTKYLGDSAEGLLG